jgi:peptidoglycan/xylan/chitin deacetylase (PgdA/CDA1 family)
LAVGVLALGVACFMALLPTKGTVAQPAARVTIDVTPPPEVAKGEPPTPPAPEPSEPPDGVDCSVVACVALTFDDGPSAYDAALLDKLDELGVKATFFNTGQNTANRPEAVKRQVESGHQVGGHSWNHRDMKKLTAADACADADRTARAIRDAAGVETTLVRPPYGSWNDEILAACAGKTFVLWDVDTEDWLTHDPAKITAHAVNDPKPGSIILMHDTVAETIDALPGIVSGLKARGFELVTVAGLFNDPIAPGQAIYFGPRAGAPTS